MGYDVYLSWDGMTTDEMQAQDVLWDLRAGHVGYLRAATWMQRETQFLSRVLPGVPWWEGPPRTGNARPFDFEKNFRGMEEAARKYLKDAGARHDIDYIMTLPLRTLDSENSELHDSATEHSVQQYATDHLTGDDAEDWIRSVVDFFRLGLRRQKEGKNPRVEVT